MAAHNAKAWWDPDARAWIVLVPSFGPTRLTDTWPPDASHRDLLVGIRRQFGAQNVAGIKVEKVSRPPRRSEEGAP